MSTAALQSACQAGTHFATRFFERYPFPWPDITTPEDGEPREHRTAGRWEPAATRTRCRRTCWPSSPRWPTPRP